MVRRSVRIAAAAAAAAEKRKACDAIDSGFAKHARTEKHNTCDAIDSDFGMHAHKFVIDTDIVHCVVGMHDPVKLRSVTFCYKTPSGFSTPPENIPGCELVYNEDPDVILGELMQVAEALRCWWGVMSNV